MISCKVRSLVTSEKVVPFEVMKNLAKESILVSGTNQSWNKIEIYARWDMPVSTLEREPVMPGGPGEATLAELREKMRDSLPVNAREWLEKYLSTVKAVYTFNVFPEDATWDAWTVLGGFQNFLKDALGGIIQADNEGYYNEQGHYILWQMYEGASGVIPAASLNDKGEWVNYPLRLKKRKDVELFKQGIAPRKGFFDRLLGV